MDILEVRQLIRDKANKAIARILDQEKRCQDRVEFAINADAVLKDYCGSELDFMLIDGSYDLVLCFDWCTHGHNWLLPKKRKALSFDFAVEGFILITTDCYDGWLVIEDKTVNDEVEPQKIHIQFSNTPHLNQQSA